MRKNFFNFVVLAIAIMVIGFAANARAEILYADDFNGANNGDGNYGLNDNLANRQAAGTLGVVQWARLGATVRAEVNNAAWGGTDVMGFGQASKVYGVIIDHDFMLDNAKIGSAGGYTIRFDMDPMALGSTETTTTSRGATVSIGSTADGGPDSLSRYGLYSDSSDYTFGVYNNAWWGSGNKGNSFANWTHGDPIWTKFDANAPYDGFVHWYTFEVRIATTSLAAGTAYTADIFWGHQGTPSNMLTQLDANGTASGLTWSGTWDAGTTHYISFTGDCSVNAIDNVSISIVPEPGTLALLACGLIGLLAYAWRKRK